MKKERAKNKNNKEQELNFLEGKEKKEIIEILNTQFGIKNIPGRIIKKGKEKIFLYTGELNKEEILKIKDLVPIERIGVYLAKQEERGIRLSIEGSQILKNEITKNTIELDKNEMETWMKGHEVLKNTNLRGYVIIKYKEEMLGTGKASEEKITNFIPKSRRLKLRG